MKLPPSILVQLVHISGPLKGQIQEFSVPEIKIGRQDNCNVLFPKDLTTISRLHAELTREGNRFKLTDKSSNGTFVNGKKIIETYLKDGDVIMFTEGGPKVSFLATLSDAVSDEAVAVEEPKYEPVKQKESEIPVQPVKAAPIYEQPKPVISAPVLVAEHIDTPVEKVAASLIVQYGPTLRSYKELPIVMGKAASCDFVVSHASVADKHAQIVFKQGTYFIRDLTGKNLITVSGHAVGFEVPLKTDDIIYLSSRGPAFRFLGEGRLAEYEEATPEEEPSAPTPKKQTAEPENKSKGFKGFMDIFKK